MSSIVPQCKSSYSRGFSSDHDAPHSLLFLAPAGVNGLRMLGILHDAVVFLVEQLSGAKHCRNYKFRFHKPEEANEPPINPHGSARAEVHLRQVAVWDLV